MNANIRIRYGLRDEHGLSLIEIVVSMFLLALLVLSFTPVLVNTLKLTARNTTIVTATQIVNQQIEAARAVRSTTATVPSCDDIRQFLLVTQAPVVDPRGVTLQARWDPFTACTSRVSPGYVRVKVSVTQSGFASPTASAATLIFVTAGGN
jgi:Tfp pilus assembly protein PilV